MITLKLISIARDGGTQMFINTDADINSIEDFNKLSKYYLDGRIGSSTKGELYDRHPNEKDAIILDKSQFVFPILTKTKNK